jgi:prepilin-type N-terminal cleavage/methylation domain-containing protein
MSIVACHDCQTILKMSDLLFFDEECCVKRLHQYRGLTLIELVIVIVLLSILMSVAVPSYLQYAAVARATRLNGFATQLMAAAQLANYNQIIKGLDPSDLVIPGDDDAVYGWPKKGYVCNLLYQQTPSGTNAQVTEASTPISCADGILKDGHAPTTCLATYYDSAGSGIPAFVDISAVTPDNCR